MNAAKLIKTGEVIELGHVLGDKMPFFGTRRFDVHTKRTFMNQPSNRRGSNEEIVISEIGQVGTQFDGFAHQTHENSWYNCFKVDENVTRTRLPEARHPQCRRRVHARRAHRRRRRSRASRPCPTPTRSPSQDLEDALKKQNTTLQPGDAILINTGWHKLWAKDNARYVKSCPGIGVKAAEWLDRQGADPARLRQLAGRGLARTPTRSSRCRCIRSRSS